MNDDKKLELYKNLLIKKRKKGLEDLYFFNKYILESSEERRKNIVPHVHKEWADWFKNSDSRIKMLLVPRNTFKTTFFTEGWSLQQIAKNRDVRILLANATLANSQRFLSSIKHHIRKNKTFKELYGNMYGKKLTWKEDEIVVKGREKGLRESTVTAIGAGGNLVSQHYDIIICDDLVNNENSATKYQADKVIDWWKKSLALLEPQGKMLVIGTRWAYYELYSYLLDEFPGRIDTYIKKCYNKDGSLYFPERFNEQKLQELKEFHGSYIFSSFYLNNPVDEDSALIKKSHLHYYTDDGSVCHNKNCGKLHKKPSNVKTFSVCDPAVSQEATADFSTIVTVDVDSWNNWWIKEIRRGRWTVGQLVEELFSVYKRHKPETMSIELIGQAQGLMAPIQREEDLRNVYLPLVEIKARNQTKKEARIRSILQPRFERGKIFIKKRIAGIDDLENELLRFPKSKHDDIIDPLTDVEEIGYSPDKVEKKETEKSGYFETKLKESFNKEKRYIDPVMGEHF